MTTFNTGCKINDDWDYKKMRVVFMENTLLRVGILVDKGSDIFEFTFKPGNIDPLLRLSGGIRNPYTEINQFPNSKGRFEDYYYGGWQEILPNSPVFNYRGAMLGQHGELSLKPWKYAIIANTNEEVSLKVWTDLLRLPLTIEKTLTLKRDDSTLYINESLTNRGKTTLDIMWGHHIALGLPFLDDEIVIETNAATFDAEPLIPAPRKFKPGRQFTWPTGQSSKGGQIAANIIPAAHESPYSELIYLHGYQGTAFCKVKNKAKNIAFNITWQPAVFKCLWCWQERYASTDFPWWGQCYAVAFEPWTSAWTSRPEEAIANNEWLKITAGQTITTQLTAGMSAIEN